MKNNYFWIFLDFQRDGKWQVHVFTESRSLVSKNVTGRSNRAEIHGATAPEKQQGCDMLLWRCYGDMVLA